MFNYVINLPSTFLLPLLFFTFLSIIHFLSLPSPSPSPSSTTFDPFQDPRLIAQERAILRAYQARHIDDTFQPTDYDAEDDHSDFDDDSSDLDSTLYIDDEDYDDDNLIRFDDIDSNDKDAEECWERMKIVVMGERLGSPGIDGFKPKRVPLEFEDSSVCCMGGKCCVCDSLVSDEDDVEEDEQDEEDESEDQDFEDEKYFSNTELESEDEDGDVEEEESEDMVEEVGCDDFDPFVVDGRKELAFETFLWGEPKHRLFDGLDAPIKFDVNREVSRRVRVTVEVADDIVIQDPWMYDAEDGWGAGRLPEFFEDFME